MKATDFAECPDTDAALMCWLVAALASDPVPIPSTMGPLRVAINAKAARKHRIFFIDTPLMLFQASDVLFTNPPASAGGVLVIEWAHAI